MIRLTGRIEGDLAILRYKALLDRAGASGRVDGPRTARLLSRASHKAADRIGKIAQQRDKGRQRAGRPGALDASREAG